MRGAVTDDGDVVEIGRNRDCVGVCQPDAGHDQVATRDAVRRRSSANVGSLSCLMLLHCFYL